MHDSEHPRFSSMSCYHYVDAGGNIALGTLVNNFHFLLISKVKEH